MIVIVKTLVAVLLADFVSGLVHWLEDAYARPDMRWIGKIAQENLEHHDKPRAFLRKSWWESSWDLLLLGLLAVAAAAWTHHLSGYFLLFTVLVINANQLHKWTHSNRQELPGIVHWLQEHAVLQTRRHHARHHGGERDSHYCVITNQLNPVLEYIGFWKHLEGLIEFVTGVARRRDQDYLPS